MDYQHESETALRIARRAGELALQYFSEKTSTDEKEDLSPVTIADRECEMLVSRLLSESFPEDGVIGEEGTFKASTSGRRWLIDPIDGTREFVRRSPFWSTMIALQVSNHVVLGIIYFPYLNDMLYAADGQGCYWNNSRTEVSDISSLDKAILLINGFKSVWDAWTPAPVRYLTENCWAVRSYGGCYDMLMLARGKADIWLSGSGKEWDYAPARIVAQECGAEFLTKDGTARINANHCVICVPGLEAILRKILNISP